MLTGASWRRFNRHGWWVAGGGADLWRRLTIKKDSRIGTYGARLLQVMACRVSGVLLNELSWAHDWTVYGYRRELYL